MRARTADGARRQEEARAAQKKVVSSLLGGPKPPVAPLSDDEVRAKVAEFHARGGTVKDLGAAPDPDR